MFLISQTTPTEKGKGPSSMMMMSLHSARYSASLTSRRVPSSLCHHHYRLVHIEKRLAEKGITLPKPSSPRANYNIVCRASGNMLYVSGHLPIRADGSIMTGRIGPKDSGGGAQTVAHGYEAARYAGLNIISTLKDQLGDLDRVKQVVKVRV
jgi:enamine deaminase RidA (YjgF/YER057c/UK114 family)